MGLAHSKVSYIGMPREVNTTRVPQADATFLAPLPCLKARFLKAREAASPPKASESFYVPKWLWSGAFQT